MINLTSIQSFLKHKELTKRLVSCVRSALCCVWIKCKTCIWKKLNSWFLAAPGNVWQPYLIPPHGLLFSCRLIEKTDSLFSAGQMSFSDRWGLLFKQRGAEVLSNSGEFVIQNQLAKKRNGTAMFSAMLNSLQFIVVMLLVQSQWVTANTIMAKYVETVALPNNYDELISFLKMVGGSDRINRRAGLSYQDGTHCSIVSLWCFSSGSTERATEQQSCVRRPATNHGNWQSWKQL